MSEVITADLVDLDLKAADRQSASRQLAERLVKAGRVTDIEGFLADISNIIFLIAAPEGGDASHMKILASLARRLIRAQFKETLRSVKDPAEAAEFIRKEVS